MFFFTMTSPRDLCLNDVVRLLSEDDVVKVATSIKCVPPTREHLVAQCTHDAASRRMLVNFLFSGCKTPPRSPSPSPMPECPPPPVVRQRVLPCIPTSWRIEAVAESNPPVTPMH